MSLKVSSLFVLSLITYLFVSCSPEHSKIVIAEYDDSKITMNEFEKAYAKNVGGYENAAQDSFTNYKNFADLYINFKMKLKDAESKGYQNLPELNQELLDYKKKVGASYLLEKYLVDPAIKNLYDKRKIEIRASHIMIRPQNNDWDAAKKLADAIMDSIKLGASFDEMVKKYSMDKYSVPKGGDIYYFTAGQLPFEFEDAAYKTEKGQVYPEVVKTNFGYHIIKVTDKEPRKYKIRASHIMASFTNNLMAIKDTNAAKAKMDTILAALKSGEDFAEVAKKYSDDPGTKEQGGDLGYFERRTMVPEFEDAAFKLDVGQVSGVVKTVYGLHIIKVTDKLPYPTLEEERENLKNILKRTEYNDLYNAFADSLAKSQNLIVNETAVQQIVGFNDSTFVGSDLKGADQIGETPVFTIANNSVTVNDLYSKMKNDTEFAGKRINNDLVRKAVNKFKREFALEEKALTLDQTDTQFADLMQDYKNGIFIFKLQEDEIWNKVKIDSSKLADFYEKTKNNYVWKDRVAFTEIFSKQDSLIKDYYNQLKSGVSFDSLAKKSERPKFKDSKDGKSKLQNADASELAKAAFKLKAVGDYTEPIPNAGGFSIIRLDIKDPSRLKTFEEAKPEVLSAYQESESKRMEDEYLDSLKKKYEPVIYYDELQEAYKTENK